MGLLTKERLRDVLGRLKGAEDVIVERQGGKLVAIVVSPDYEGVNEGDRQAKAWSLLLQELTDEEHAQVSFVYTNTPEEKAEAERDAASG